MKKTLSCLLLLMMLLSLSIQGLAAGRLEIVQENLFQLSYYEKTVTCHYFTELKNSGDKPVEFTRGLLELFDPDGNSVESADISYCYPRVLQPGETAFISSQLDVDTALHTVNDQMLSLMQQGKLTQKVVRLESEATMQKIDDGYSMDDYLVCHIKNTSGEVVREFDVVLSMRDSEGNILWICTSNWYDYDFGLMPDSSMELRVETNNSFINYWTENGLVPTKVDTIAYIQTSL